MEQRFDTCQLRLDDGSCALVESMDLHRVSTYTWRAVEINGREQIVALESLVPTTQPPVMLARFIANATDGERVIAFNGDMRDCRRSNLAIVSARELARLEDGLRLTAV